MQMGRAGLEASKPPVIALLVAALSAQSIDSQSVLERVRSTVDARTVTHDQECGQFFGKSELHFDGTAAEGRPGDLETTCKRLPAGLRLRIRITSSVNPKTARAGDAVQGELASDVRDENWLIDMTKGTIAHGHLLGPEIRVRPGETVSFLYCRSAFPGLIIRWRRLPLESQIDREAIYRRAGLEAGLDPTAYATRELVW